MHGSIWIWGPLHRLEPWWEVGCLSSFFILITHIMNLLQIFFIISGLIIFLVALDIARRERFNALHFLVFLGVGSGLLVFTVFPQSLSLLGQLF